MKKNSLLVIILSVIVFVSFGCKKQSVEKDIQPHDSSQPKVYMEYKNNPDWRGGEMGSIVSTAYFTGQVREAYAERLRYLRYLTISTVTVIAQKTMVTGALEHASQMVTDPDAIYVC